MPVTTPPALPSPPGEATQTSRRTGASPVVAPSDLMLTTTRYSGGHHKRLVAAGVAVLGLSVAAGRQAYSTSAVLPSCSPSH